LRSSGVSSNEHVFYRDLTFDTKTLAQLADGAATVTVSNKKMFFLLVG
jgi:hypothetical protein